MINNSLTNSFTNSELEMMIDGNNPQSNAYRELLAYRKAALQLPTINESDLEAIKSSLRAASANGSLFAEGDKGNSCTVQQLALVVPEVVPDALRDEIIDLCDGYEIGDVGAQEIWGACRTAILNNTNACRVVSKPE
jgi:hypothetical protein